MTTKIVPKEYLFSCLNVLWFLRESLRNHGDGTFSSASVYFSNFMWFSKKNTIILPCWYVALPDKKTETYVEVIDAIKVIVKPLADRNNTSLPYFPQVILTNFEITIMNAFRHCFPGIEVKGCYFHFKHAHQGWLCRHGWKKMYRTSNEFRIWVLYLILIIL